MNDSYFDPPAEHEVCECFECHNAGDHDDRPVYWHGGCDFCTERNDDNAVKGCITVKFDVLAVDKALAWAGLRKYKYDELEHLLFDAMTAGVIVPIGYNSI